MYSFFMQLLKAEVISELEHTQNITDANAGIYSGYILPYWKALAVEKENTEQKLTILRVFSKS